MAKKRRTRKRKSSFPWRRALALVAAVLAGCGALGYEFTPRLSSRSGRVFAAFARLDVTPDQYVRMKGEMLSLRRKPDAAKWRRIVEIVDGDSVKLEDGVSVRLVGIDSPESSENRKFYADLGKMNLLDAKDDLLAMGRTAAMAARARAVGKNCWLETEAGGARDQYDRTLAIIHLEDGTILNEWMISQGYARAYTAQTFRYKKRYIALQLAAQRKGAGFWNDEARQER